MPYKSRKDVLDITHEQFTHAEPFNDALNIDRSEAIDYYLGRRPGPIPNRSKHTTLDVLDTVEEIRALYLEMLNSGNDVVEFTPRSSNDRVSGIAAQAYVNDHFLHRNPGAAMFMDFVFDAAMYKIGIWHLEWEERDNEAVYSFYELTEDEATALVESPDVVMLSIEDDGAGLYTGRYRETSKSPRVKLRLVRPDHWYMQEMATDVYNPNFVTEKIGMAEGDMRAVGIPQNKIELLPHYQYNDAQGMSQTTQSILGSEPTPNSVQSGRDLRRFYNSFIVSDFERKNDLRLYQVRWSENELIDYKQVHRHRYFWWTPIRISHKTIGLGYADTTKGVQAHSTTIRRGILDHTVATTNRTRYVNENMFVDSQRLYNEQYNEVHNVLDVDNAVREAEIPQLSPLTGDVLQMLEGEKDKRSGFTATARGANQDVISKQNSRDMVNAMSNAGMRRPAQHFRVLLYQCMIPLYRAILDLGAEHDRDNPIYRYGAGEIVFKPGNLNSNTLMFNVASALTPQERSQQGDNLIAMHTLFSDPNSGLGNQYLPKNRYELIQRVMKLKGINDPQSLLASPQDPDYIDAEEQARQMQERQQEQAEQLQQAQLQIQGMVAEAEMRKAEAAREKNRNDLRIDELKLVIEDMKIMLEELRLSQEGAISSEEIQTKRRELNAGIYRDAASNAVARDTADTARIKALADVRRADVREESAGNRQSAPNQTSENTGTS